MFVLRRSLCGKESIVFIQDKKCPGQEDYYQLQLDATLRYATDRNGSTESTPGNMISARRINVSIAPASSETLTGSTLLAKFQLIKIELPW